MKIDKIGKYKILKQIAQGGMGEIFLAFDPSCKRTVALKRIREDLKNRPIIRKRFLKEAKIASQLTHPSIVPIYAIHEAKDSLYYTMPYVEGKTLKDILLDGVKLASSESSIPNLIRIFLAVSEAMAFVHSKNILHRDLKPANILVGKYGEVLILDWGIATYMNESLQPDSSDISTQEQSKAKNDSLSKIKPKDYELEQNNTKNALTLPGKISGTLTYLAPECVLGERASILSDIYALGVILYQILTLRSPFKRTSVADFRKKARMEKVPDPSLSAPYRDIPLALSKICKKCLSFEKKERYQQLHDLILDLKNYIEGKPEWLLRAILDLKDPKAFIFQENVYLPKTVDSPDWASVWLAKATLSGSFKISFEFLLKENSAGLGVLFSVPEHLGKYLIEEGILIFFGYKKKPYVELSNGPVLILRNQHIPLKKRTWHHVEIEKFENNIRCYLNGKLVLSYISYIPIFGSHLGLFFKDSSFLISNFKLLSASSNLLVSCLALPDAFLAKKDLDAAYFEYKRIAASFPGRAEEREALFRAGITVLEKAKQLADPELFERALTEFEHLRKTSGSPLEYLGKSIVYATKQEYEEEAKCLELAIRKFKDHPLLDLLKNHLLLRLHESSFAQREAHIRLMLTFLLIFSKLNQLPDTDLLFQNLDKNLPLSTFLQPSKQMRTIDLAFRLDKKNVLLELLDKLNPKTESADIENIFLALLEMGETNIVKEKLKQYPISYLQTTINMLENKSQKPNDLSFLSSLQSSEKTDLTCLDFLLEKAVFQKKPAFIWQILDQIKIKNTTKLASFQVWACLIDKNLKKAEEILKTFSEEERADENSPLFIPYGLYLHLKGSEEVAKLHFTSPMDSAYPSFSALFGLFITGSKREKWQNKLLPYEKRQLSAFLKLYTDLTKKSFSNSFFKF